MARTKPPLDIDAEHVRKLAELGLNNVDIAGFFGCDESTIRKRFPEYLSKGRIDRRIVLHTGQYQAAKDGNIAMLIWLGKQELGQSEKSESKISGVRGPVEINLTQLDDHELGSLQTIAGKLAIGTDAIAPGEPEGG
jgi:hypothetical protein